tara:strand:- start:508 stop:942 length:435 start_codon:yes stop_codon:yes gene_type:complete
MSLAKGLTKLLLIASLAISSGVFGEQMQRFGNLEVHYIVVPTTFLDPKVAQSYSISRAKNQAIVNLSVINNSGNAIKCSIEGEALNLLGQRSRLEFREIVEDKAIYYIAQLRHDDEEIMRFLIDILMPSNQSITLEFNQKLYWE